MPGARRSETTLRANSRRLNPDLRAARGKFRKWGRDVKADLGKSFSGIRRELGTLAGFGGVAGVAVLARDVVNFERDLTRLQIASGSTAAEMAEFRDEIGQVSNSTGQSRADLLAAASQFTALTGDIDTARASLELFARVSAASGASLTDVAATAASLRDNFGIAGAEMEAAFSALTVQGKAGSIEIRDLASLLSSVAPQFTQFGAKGADALAQAGAAMQVVRKNFGDSAQAATGLRSLMTAMVKDSARLRKMGGVEVFEIGPDGVKRMRRFDDIIEDISKSKLAEDPELLSKALGREEAARAAMAFMQFPGLFEKLVKESKDAGVIQRDFATYSESSAARISKAWERAKNEFAKVLTPERIEKFAEALEKLVRLLEFVIDHLEEIVIIAVGGKLLQLGAGFAQAAAGAGGLSTALGGAVSKANALVGALTAGLALGTAFDKATGLSDWLSDKFAGVDSSKQRIDTMYANFDRKISRAISDMDQTVREQNIRHQRMFDEAGRSAEGPFGRPLSEVLAKPPAPTSAPTGKGEVVEHRVTVDEQGLLRADQVKQRRQRRGR